MPPPPPMPRTKVAKVTQEFILQGPPSSRNTGFHSRGCGMRQECPARSYPCDLCALSVRHQSLRPISPSVSSSLIPSSYHEAMRKPLLFTRRKPDDNQKASADNNKVLADSPQKFHDGKHEIRSRARRPASGIFFEAQIASSGSSFSILSLSFPSSSLGMGLSWKLCFLSGGVLHRRASGCCATRDAWLAM